MPRAEFDRLADAAMHFGLCHEIAGESGEIAASGRGGVGAGITVKATIYT